MRRSPNDRLGLEALIQRGKSPLFNDLVSLYQNSIDAVSDYKKPSHGDVTLTIKSIKFKEQLKSVVFKHMGILLARVTVIETSVMNAMAYLGYTDKTWNQTIASLNNNKINMTNGVMIEKINKFYDDKTAKLDPAVDLKKLPFEFSLSFTTAMWRVKEDDQSSYFTAEEMAAFTLHELGHLDHYIRSAIRIFGRALDASDIITYISYQPDPKVIKVILDRFKNVAYLNDEFRMIVKTTEAYFKTNPSPADPDYLEAISVLSTLMIADVSFYDLLTLSRSMGSLRDKVGTSVQKVDSERSADEFAARNGAYSAIVSGVAKIHSLYENKHNVALRQFMWNGPSLFFGSFRHFFSLFALYPEEFHQGYDPHLRRLELIVEAGKHAFHDEALPEDAKADIMEQIVEAEKCIALFRSAPHRQARAKFKAWKDSIAKLGRIVASPFQNRLSGDYDRLQNATRSLTRHPLYYLSDKASR